MKGLSSAEASDRLLKFGFNELKSAKRKGVLRIALDVISEPIFILLIACGILYMLLGDYKEGFIMLCTIFIIIFISFYQSNKTEKALEALKNLSSPRALVIRDGAEIRIPGREVVLDDIVILREGDRIPADGDILDSDNLTLDESLLTGESVPILRHSGEKVYSGTLVVQGRGKIKVMHTGSDTEFGKIGEGIESIEQDKTRLQKEMGKLVRNLFIVGGVMSITVVLLFYFSRGNLLQSLLNGLSSAMAILPEEFPVVFTVFLALGAWRLSQKNVLTRNPTAIETLGAATVLCSDKTGTITLNRMELCGVHLNGTYTEILENDLTLRKALQIAMLASDAESIDPMEKAIATALQKNKGEIMKYTLDRSFHLSKDLPVMTNLYSLENGELYAATKGAPEFVFGLCHLSEKELGSARKAQVALSEKGFRVLALASAVNVHLSVRDQKDLRLKYEGLLAFEDPVREEVPEAVKQCQKAGIRVIMITGDFPVTARSIGNKAGLDAQGSLITGDELNSMDDAQLRSRIGNVSIFARVKPEQKLRIVMALKANGEVVAMTGDGVNDAPALKAADIGISMGNKGTDVAREASSLVLLDDNFASIVAGLRSGRRIFDNLQKAMAFIIAVHIPIIGLALLPAVIPELPVFFMPLHIVMLELIIDPVCSIVFESEQEEQGIMDRKPRDTQETFFGWKKMLQSAIQGLLLFLMVLVIYFLSIHEGHTEGEVRAIAFSSLIIGNIFLILAGLSKTRSFIYSLAERNLALMILLPIILIMLITVISVPSLASLFGFSFPGYTHFGTALAGAFSLLLVLETIKYFQFKNDWRT